MGHVPHTRGGPAAAMAAPAAHLAAPLWDPPSTLTVRCGVRVTDGAAFARRVAALAHGLRQAGLRAGDRVAVMTGPLPGGGLAPFPSDAAFAALLAAAAAGGVTCPLACRAPAAELGAMLRLLQARFLVVAPPAGAAAAAAVVASRAARDGAGPPTHGLPAGPAEPTIVWLDGWAGGEGGDPPSGCLHAARWLASTPPPPLPLASAPGDAAAIVFTSGSSGAPKGALLTHAGIRFQSDTKIAFLGLTPRLDAVALVPAPLSHVGGLSMAAAALAVGAGVAFPVGGWPRGAPLAALEAARATHLSIVPAMAVDLAAAAGGRGAGGTLGRVRAALVGAGPPPPAATLRAALPAAAVHTAYGLTEAGSSVLWGRAPSGAGAAPSAAAGGAPAGRPPPGADAAVAVALSDAPFTWRPAAPGEVGELLTRGPHVFAGYWRDEGATAAALAPPASRVGPTPLPPSPHPWLRTRDAAVADAAGMVWVLGRGGDAIRVGGETVHGARVEAALARAAGVAAVAVVAVPDARLGSVPGALVSLERGVVWRGPVAAGEAAPPGAGCGTPLSLAPLRRAAADAGLPTVALPRLAVATWRGLPTRGPLGKVDRAAVAEAVVAATAHARL